MVSATFLMNHVRYYPVILFDVMTLSIYTICYPVLCGFGLKISGGFMAVIKNIQEKYMKDALKQAKKAFALGEVPIGCVIVYEGKIIGRGYNRRNTDKNTLSHAEITAIRKASKVIGDWRLEGCTLYVTLEPCQMCAGAIIQARIPSVVIGCMNPKAGCAGSILNVLEMPEFNHQADVIRGVMEQECSDMLKAFFADLRIRNKAEKEQKKSLETEEIT